MKSNFKNKIITLSGDPGSGKSTVVRELKKKYMEQGYKEENIHCIKVGDIFRKIAVQRIKEKYPDIQNITITQINEDPKFQKDIEDLDKEVDLYIAEKGRKINSQYRPNDVYIIDSRLAWFNIPDSFSVKLTINDQSAGERIFNDSSRGSEDKFKSIEEAIQNAKARKEAEIKRYKETYGADLGNEDNYKVIIDTTYSDVSEIADVIIQCENAYEQDKYYNKKWASPKIFLPNQRVKETYEPQTIGGETVMDIKDSIEKNGYDMNFPIEVKQKGNTIFKTIVEGHHRNFASIMLNKTLIPYIELGKEEEDTLTRRELSKIYDHEDVFKFRYPSYPKCIEDVMKEDNYERDS